MKTRLFVAAASLPVLVSCDPTAKTVVRSSVAEPFNRAGDVTAALRQVAKERGYETLKQPKAKASGEEERDVIELYSKKLEPGHSHVMLGLARDQKSGEVEVQIMDYFRFTRSDESREVERALRARLQQRN